MRPSHVHLALVLFFVVAGNPVLRAPLLRGQDSSFSSGPTSEVPPLYGSVGLVLAVNNLSLVALVCIVEDAQVHGRATSTTRAATYHGESPGLSSV